MAEQSFKVDGGIEASGIITATTFARVGGSSTMFLKADGSIDVGIYKTTDTNTTYDISAGDFASNKKIIRLNDGSTNKDVVIAGGEHITITRTNDEISIAGTDTTYDINAVDHHSDNNKKNIRLVAGGSGAGTTDITLAGGNNITLARTNNEIAIHGPTDTDTTYTFAAIDGSSSDEKILRITNSNSIDDDITLVAGVNVGISRSGERITLSSTDTNTNTTYSHSSVADGSGNVNLRLTAGGSGSGDDDILVTAGNNITIDSIGPNGFRIAADDEDDTLISVTNRGRITTNGIEIGDLKAGIGTFTGSVSIGGNLTVNGTQTIINSNTLQVGDSQILLNKDETGTPSQNAGLQIERGTSTNVQLRWNETNDKWEFTNDGSTYQNIPTTNTTYGVSAVDGNPNQQRIRLTGSNPSTTDDVVLAGGTGITLTRSNDEITITNSAPESTDSSMLVPVGFIGLWSGSSASIPTGWALCDGGGGRPDLRNRFVIGAGSGYNVDATGGSTDAVLVEHTHGAGNYSTNNTGAHTHGAGNFATNNTGNHTHGYNTRTLTSVHSYGDSNQTRPSNSTTSTPTGNAGAHAHNVSGNTSSEGSHAHNVSGSSSQNGESAAGKNMPPYYALCYIIKT